MIIIEPIGMRLWEQLQLIRTGPNRLKKRSAAKGETDLSYKFRLVVSYRSDHNPNIQFPIPKSKAKLGRKRAKMSIGLPATWSSDSDEELIPLPSDGGLPGGKSDLLDLLPKCLSDLKKGLVRSSRNWLGTIDDETLDKFGTR